MWRNRLHRVAHLPEVLQRSGDVLQLRPCTQTFAEPRGERQGRHHHGQCLYLRRGEQRAQREEWCSAAAKWQGRRTDEPPVHL